jgi:hypothetical protein
MTIRIAAGFLAILATGLIAAPVETSARGGRAFGGGHAMSFRGGFRAPMSRPAIARPQRVAVPARIRGAPSDRAGCGSVRLGTVTMVRLGTATMVTRATPYRTSNRRLPRHRRPLGVWGAARRLTRSRRKLAGKRRSRWCVADWPTRWLGFCLWTPIACAHRSALI